MSTDPTLTAERLREVLDYDPDTGVFRWKVPRGPRGAGTVAGNADAGDGHRRIGIDGEIVYAHRLVWLYVYGEWPRHQLDHRNQDKDDNRLANLREDPQGQNQQNVTRPRSNNSSGFRGVAFHKRTCTWDATIFVDGGNRYLGSFDTPEDASAAYLAAKRKLHPFWAAP